MIPPSWVTGRGSNFLQMSARCHTLMVGETNKEISGMVGGDTGYLATARAGYPIAEAALTLCTYTGLYTGFCQVGG